MRAFLRALTAVALVATGAAARADDTAARAVIEKAVKATGGADNIAKYKAANWKAKGKLPAFGDMVYTGEWAVEPDRSRVSIRGGDENQQMNFTAVYNRGKGWRNINGNQQDLEGEDLEAQKEEMYAQGLTRLNNILDAGNTFTAVKEVQIDGHSAAGVKVSHAGHRDVTLYFDKDSGLLAKSQSTVKNPQTGEDTAQEVLYKNYKEIQGVQQPTKVTIIRDGNPFIDSERFDIKLSEKLDDSLFEQPKADAAKDKEKDKDK